MAFGPIVRRELLTASRRKSTYWNRTAPALAVLCVIGLHAGICDYIGRDRTSLAGGRSFALQTFGQVVSALAIMAAAGSVAEIAPIIAREREKKSIDALLASNLRSAEIVLGALGAGMLRQLSSLAAVFPIMALLVPFWGVNPWLILLAYAGLFSFTFAQASVSILASVRSPSARAATLLSIRFFFFWMILPLLCMLILPKHWPNVASWVNPVAVQVFDSTPMAVMFSIIPVFGRGPFMDVLAKMIVMQIGIGVLTTLLASVRLRPASRALYDLEGVTFLKRMARRAAPRRRRPPCGDDPVFWRDVHAIPLVNIYDRITGALLGWAVVAISVAAFYWFAVPAYIELAENGFGVSAGHSSKLDMHPLTRLIVQWKIPAPPSPPGMARVELAMIVRQLTAVCNVFIVLILAGAVTESIAMEKEKDTWLGLIVTPLSGKEIVRAKMLGQICRLRAFFTSIVILNLIGLTSRAIHPVGFLLGMGNFALSCWLMAAIGARCAIPAKGRKDAMNRMIIPSILLSMSGVIVFILPAAVSHVTMGIACPPFLTWLSLVDYEEFRAIISKGFYPALDVIGQGAYPAAWWVMLTLVLGMVAQAAAAYLLTRSSYRVFDTAVGRPVRSSKREPRRVIEPKPECELVA